MTTFFEALRKSMLKKSDVLVYNTWFQCQLDRCCRSGRVTSVNA